MKTVSGTMTPNGLSADFQRIVTEYEKILSAFVLKRAPERDADDIVQETFVKAYLKIDTLQNPDSLKPWLFAICRNCLGSHLRKQKKEPDLHADTEIWQELMDLSGDTCSAAEIGNAMERLEYAKRQYLVLKYWAGFNYAEIAVLLRTTEKKVKSRMYESRQLLKNLLERPSSKKSFAPQLSLKERIMKKIETVKKAAEIFAQLSLASQLEFSEFVRENKIFDADLLAACAEVTGGAEFVTECHGKLSIQEFADILQAVDGGTMLRLFNNLEKKHGKYAEELKTEIALAEVNIMPGVSLQLETEKIADSRDSIIIRLIGYLDMYNSDLFESRLRALITAGYRFLILDCGRFTYISSSGIGTLVTLLKDISLQNGTIFMCNLDSRIWEVFSLLGISTFFKKPASINQALEICEKEQAYPIAPESDEQEIIPLLPKENGGDTRLEISGFSRFSQDSTCSYYDYKPLAGGSWAVLMSEAAGTGPNTQLIRSKIAAAFHHYFEHTEAPYNVTEFMYALNSQILSLNLKNRFAAITVMLVNGVERSCTVCSAGDCSLTAYKHKEQKTAVLPTPTGPAAGTFPNWLVRARNPYTAVEFSLNSGDELYLFTDGLEDSRNSAGESFGRERISEIITAMHLSAAKTGKPVPGNPGLCVDALASAERAFRGQADSCEDIMIVALAFT